MKRSLFTLCILLAAARASGDPGELRVPAPVNGIAFYPMAWGLATTDIPEVTARNHGMNIDVVESPDQPSLWPYPHVDDAYEKMYEPDLGFIYFLGHGKEGGDVSGGHGIMYWDSDDPAAYQRSIDVLDSLNLDPFWSGKVDWGRIYDEHQVLQAYTIYVLYPAIAAWRAASPQKAIAFNVCCYGGNTTCFNGTLMAGPPVSCSAALPLTAICNLCNAWDGYYCGVACRSAGFALQYIDLTYLNVIGNPTDLKVTLTPAIKDITCSEFDPVGPSGLVIEVLFNSLMNDLIEPLWFLEVTDNLRIEDAHWDSDTTLSVTVKPNHGDKGSGDFKILESWCHAWEDWSHLDGDALDGPSDYVIHLGPDNAAGLSSLKGYNAGTSNFAWFVETTDGMTSHFSLEGWWDNEWEQFTTVPPGTGPRQVAVPRPYPRVRLLEWDVGSNQPTNHGDMARGHVREERHETYPSRDSLMSRAWDRLENPAPGCPGRGGRSFFRDGEATALITKGDWMDELEPLALYLEGHFEMTVHWVDVMQWSQGEERRQGIKAEIVRLADEEAITSVFLAGDSNDWEKWTQPWPAPWDTIQAHYLETHPANGEPDLDFIPVAEYVDDTVPQGSNTGWFYPYVPTMDWYVDTDGDGVPDIDLGYVPVEDAAKVAGIAYKAMTYMDLNEIWYPFFEVAEYIGDIDYNNPGDGLHALENMDILHSLLPTTCGFTRLKQSDGDSYWRTQQFIDMQRNGQTLVLFTGPNSSRNNMASITWADIFRWSDVGEAWPGVTFTATCAFGNTCQTQRFDQQFALYQDALAEPWGGQIGGVVCFCGTEDDDLMFFFEHLIGRVMANREIPLATHVRLAKQDCASAGCYSLSVKSTVFMGAPWIILNCVPHVTDIDGDGTGELDLDQSHPNPFGESTDLRFSTQTCGPVGLTIVDASGRIVRAFAYRNMEPGVHTFHWDGRSNTGDPLPAGVYFYRLEADGKTHERRMIRIR